MQGVPVEVAQELYSVLRQYNGQQETPQDELQDMQEDATPEVQQETAPQGASHVALEAPQNTVQRFSKESSYDPE